ncbi:transmembrane protein 44 isoform X3 [Panthera pardus]|uniref:Transmembrane protein 44 isoform X3 n=1 Tax=Panthera pardus TaxID=9691 RepID=A0A9V1FK40_PANPR|nr:transmembrane protein 44 isoform X3 [Panthera pardus]XP_019304340.2 transmembrane protein 44 isoform X3 [Panthera pardus]XP_060495556.1 transmembrane protein 44 isoform X3 [Panthera onca]XP_060495557.1 transmembrane protein 44 isoform X3 [Panthera onca]
MGEAASPAPALWDWDYLDRCFARHRVCISFGLWICASSCWIAAHALLLYLRCTKKSGRDQSALCAACCLLTSLCDTIGAILARQLTIQVFTGAYLAAVDLVNFVFILFPVCGSKLKSNLGRGSRERKRRQRLRASVFALALPLSLGPGWALWATVRKASGPVRGPQRRLLESLLQDNTEIFGYLLGAIAAFGSWASRIPPLSRICQGKAFPSIHLWTRLLSALAGLLYASAIVAHDRRPEYLLRATPWFLTSLGRAALDLSIIFLSWVMKSKMRRALGFAPEARGSPDTQALLTCTDKEEESQEARSRRLENCWAHREFRLGASHHITTLQITQDNGSHQSLHGADHRARAAGRLQHHPAAWRWTDEPWRREPAGAALLPSRSGHPGPRVFQQLLRSLLHQLRP